MASAIRECRPGDQHAVVRLSLRAWEPVFSSIRSALGDEIDGLLHGDDWRAYQQKAVEAALANDSMRVWVAEDGGEVAAFVAVTLHGEDSMGEVWMLAVDPDAQNHGLGMWLAHTAEGWTREHGMRVSLISTGGDPGHAPARRTYENAGYTALPGMQYFKALR